MGMKRTTVFADENDLAILKAAAARRGVSEAELLRDAIHLAAMANRTWDEPFFTHIYPPEDDVAGQGVANVIEDVWTQKADGYKRTKNRTP